MKIEIKKKDNGYAAFLSEYPKEYEKLPYRTYVWRGAKTEEEAIRGIKSLYPELFNNAIY